MMSTVPTHTTHHQKEIYKQLSSLRLVSAKAAPKRGNRWRRPKGTNETNVLLLRCTNNLEAEPDWLLVCSARKMQKSANSLRPQAELGPRALHPLACSRLGRAFGVRNLPQSSKASRHPRQSFPFLSSTTHLGLANLGSCGRTGEESSALEAREIGHKRARRTRERSTSFSERWKETSTRWTLRRPPAERAQTPWYTHPPTFSLPPQCSRRTLCGASPVLRRSILFAFCFFFSNPEAQHPPCGTT